MNRTQVLAVIALTLGLIVPSTQVQAQNTSTYGGNGGQEFDDTKFIPPDSRITAVHVRSGPPSIFFISSLPWEKARSTEAVVESITALISRTASISAK